MDNKVGAGKDLAEALGIGEISGDEAPALRWPGRLHHVKTCDGVAVRGKHGGDCRAEVACGARHNDVECITHGRIPLPGLLFRGKNDGLVAVHPGGSADRVKDGARDVLRA